MMLPRTAPRIAAAVPQRLSTQAPASREFFEVYERPILDLQAAQTEGRVTARGLVDAYLARIAAYDDTGPRLNAIVVLNPRARDEADRLDRERALTGPRGPLHAIPVLVKGNYDAVDMPTSGGALGLATMQPTFSVKTSAGPAFHTPFTTSP
jgi:amidase